MGSRVRAGVRAGGWYGSPYLTFVTGVHARTDGAAEGLRKGLRVGERAPDAELTRAVRVGLELVQGRGRSLVGGGDGY
jgi:hypothetical protein